MIKMNKWGRKNPLIMGIAIAIIATTFISGCLESLYTTSIKDINRHPYKYDGKKVTVIGYAVPHLTSDYFELTDYEYSVVIDCTQYSGERPEISYGTKLRVTGIVDIKEEQMLWETVTTETIIMESWKYLD